MLEQCGNFHKLMLQQYCNMMTWHSQYRCCESKHCQVIKIRILTSFKRTIIAVDTCTCEYKFEVCPAWEGSAKGISCSENLSMTNNSDSDSEIRKQCGWVVSASGLQSSGPGFTSCSGHLLDLFSVVPSWNPWPRL